MLLVIYYSRMYFTGYHHLINKLILPFAQTDAAKLLGLDQPKISALSRGRLSGFSIERLFKLISILNQDIEIIIKPHHGREPHSIPHIHVRYANPIEICNRKI